MTRADVRRLALGVAHLWPMPRAVRRYLETGHGRDEARAALDSIDLVTQRHRDAAWVAFEATQDAPDAREASRAARDAQADAERCRRLRRVELFGPEAAA
jgi:hypothetical protein